MSNRPAARHRSQGGYTLIELVIATFLGVIVTGALTSVVLTSMMAVNTAVGKVEASAQIRNFELTAYDDFVHSTPPVPAGCGSIGDPCTVEPLVLRGLSKANEPTAEPTTRTVTYRWDESRKVVTRNGTRNVATNVTGFAWYLEGSGSHKSVVVNLTITEGCAGGQPCAFYNFAHVESQTLRFFPRVTG